MLCCWTDSTSWLLCNVGRTWHRIPKRTHCHGTIRRISHCMACCEVLPSLKEQDQQEFEVKRLLHLVGRAWHRVPKRPRCRGTIRRISHCMACCELLPSLNEQEQQEFEVTVRGQTPPVPRGRAGQRVLKGPRCCGTMCPNSPLWGLLRGSAKF